MADPFGTQEQGGTYKRPTQTIEGTATEIPVEPEPKFEAGSDAKTAPAGQDEPPHGDEPIDDTEHEGAELPPARTSLPELRSFFTHMAAGLLGGLVGVIGLSVAWGILDLGEGATAPDASNLEERIAKLESVPPSVNPDAVTQLETRLGELEKSGKETSPDVAELSNRVAQLESSLKTLAETAQEGGSVASAAAIAQQIAEAEQRLDAKIAEALSKAESGSNASLQQMQGEIAELRAKVGALAEAGLGAADAADIAPELDALSERIGKLESTLPELATAIGKETAGAKAAAAAVAFANLRAAISDGRPYAADLDTLSALAPNLGDLGVLPAHAEKGIPTVPELARSFAATKEAANETPQPETSGSLMDSLLASAESLVTIKRIDEPDSTDPSAAALAKAQAALDRGDLAEAVKQVETLEGKEREAFSAWLAQAHARLSANEILMRLESSLLLAANDEMTQGAQP